MIQEFNNNNKVFNNVWENIKIFSCREGYKGNNF